jgi:FkbM family methyltransferase
MIHPRIIKFCRLNLGLKPVVDYAQSRGKLMGIADLPIRTVFDVGSNVGKKARQYYKLFPEATIYCFEPVPRTFDTLQAWASRQDGRVHAFNLAIGSARGFATMHANQTHSGGSSLVGRRSAGESYLEIPVRMETLDALAGRLEVRDQIFVKIDVEGFDMEVVKGGQELLRRARAVIIEIAIPDSPDGRPGFRDFIDTMHALGYMYRGNLAHGFVNGVAHLADAVFIRPAATLRTAA